MIAFRNFSKRFGPVAAVESLTLDVAAGEVVALLGPNGSGKTTSIKAAAGLIHPSGGDVLIGNPARPAVDPVAREVSSFLPQRVAFPAQLTGHEVVDFYRRLRHASEARARDVMRFTGLNDAARRAVGTYSGGMTQRLGLAVAMLPEAPLLLLDEPTAALDPDGLRAFYRLIEDRRAVGGTVLFSSHQIGDVERLADRIVVLVEGRLVASIQAADLPAQLGERKRLDTFYADLMGERQWRRAS
jgi:Cu-processing system ATP-binding protein